MDCPRADAAIEACDVHLLRSGADPEIEAILAQHIASVAYAEFEAKIRAIVTGRCDRHGDPPLASFAGIASRRLIRSIKVTELAGALGWFGDAQKSSFQDAVANDQEAVAAWGNVVTGRHSLAHEQPSPPSLTLGDLKRDVDRAKRVLDAFADALKAEE
jgi:hypothetical protein